MTPSPSLPAGAGPATELARGDLARRLDVRLEAIRLVSVDSVEWRNASLGCPRPGMMYAQVITPGFRVTLEVEGKRYEYHTDRGRRVVLCEQPGE
jgi:hypothetical protein